MATKPAFELSLDRLIDAPRDRVFRAWVEPERIKHWFAPAPYALTVEHLDARAGGSFAMTMHAPDGTKHSFSGRYLEVVKNEKIVWTGEFPYGPRDQMRTEIEFVAEGSKTRVKARQTFSALTPETEPHAKGAPIGWRMTLDQLAAFAESNP